MWFWWFLFCCDLLVPVTMIVSGRIMWKHPPKNINGLMGYRTSRSMKNMDTWLFAHDYCGRLWWKIGWWTLVLSILVHIPFYGNTGDSIGMMSLILVIVQTIILIGSIFQTERALKETFTEEGVRK